MSDNVRITKELKVECGDVSLKTYDNGQTFCFMPGLCDESTWHLVLEDLHNIRKVIDAMIDELIKGAGQ